MSSYKFGLSRWTNANMKPYDFYVLNYYLTWIIMCCKTEKEIKLNVTKFLKESMESYKGVSAGTHLGMSIKDVQVDVLKGVGSQKDQLRMVHIKYFTRNSTYSFTEYATFNPKS